MWFSKRCYKDEKVVWWDKIAEEYSDVDAVESYFMCRYGESLLENLLNNLQAFKDLVETVMKTCHNSNIGEIFYTSHPHVMEFDVFKLGYEDFDLLLLLDIFSDIYDIELSHIEPPTPADLIAPILEYKSSGDFASFKVTIFLGED